jgi:multiple sugar transport system permease protein
VFLLRQFFLRIPKSLPEAMTLDGASELTIFFRIYLPLSRSALAVAAFFQFIYSWNDFLGPLLYLTNQETFTLSLGLQFYQSQLGGTQWHYLMAASFMTTLPIVILFFFVQRSFLQGLSFMKNVEA